ncbi:hypothetical protein [Devosia sediminis]|uniref:Secreted protein n=1 Tax=Devosia sediminis TaxID=2798801 RepID=A0A934IXY5_9HYPH|nr:hypothetical protein [Devosia sediminis]MBJ3783974.1 hypothetical protein [Devosia sediminis]
MRHIALITFAAATLLPALPALSQEAQCFQNEDYLVIAQERVAEVGTDFIIRPPARGKIACVFATQDGDVRIGEPEDPIYYRGLAGPYLVLERSTGPDGSLVIYDLDAGAFAPIIDVPADDDVLVDDQQVVYWERTDQGTAENCPDFAEHQSAGFGSVISEQRVFEVATGTISASGEWHCTNTQ